MTNHFPKPEHLDVQIEDDLVVIRIDGVIDESIAFYLGDVHDELAQQFGYALVLQHCSSTTTVTTEGRHRYFEWNKRRKYPGCVAMVGASFATKTMVMLLSRAVKLLVTVRGEIEFFDSEELARAWLDEQRVLLKKMRLPSNTGHR